VEVMEINIAKALKYSCVPIIILFSVILLSGCIGPDGPKKEYDINVTDGNSNSFYEPWNIPSERYKKGIADLSIVDYFEYPAALLRGWT
jgi:hypothetical protein